MRPSESIAEVTVNARIVGELRKGYTDPEHVQELMHIAANVIERLKARLAEARGDSDRAAAPLCHVSEPDKPQ